MNKIQRILESEIGKAKCINCGSKWGKHQGIKCPGAMSTFYPDGFSLYDICKNCGEILENHNRYVECKGKVHFFEKIEIIDMFNDKDFEL